MHAFNMALSNKRNLLSELGPEATAELVSLASGACKLSRRSHVCIRDLALFCGQLDISYTNFLLFSPQDKAHFDFMAEELERAAQELSQFEGHIPSTLFQKNHPRAPQGELASQSTETPAASRASSPQQDLRPTAEPMDIHSSAKRGAQLPEARQDQESETLEEPQAKYSKAAGKGNLTPQQPNPPASEERDRSQTRQRTDNRRSQDRAYPDSSSDQRRGQGQDKWWQRNWNRDKSDKDSKEVQDLKALVKDLSRLVLRQSDALSYLQLDVGFMLFLKTTMTPHLEKEPEAAVDWTIVPNLYKVATKWHTDKEKAPDTLVTTLRTTLFYCTISTLLDRVTDMSQKPQDLERLRTLGIMEGNTFLYLKWNQDTKKHDKAEREHPTLEQILQWLETIKKSLAFPKVIMRFHALRRMTPQMSAEVVPFTLEIHNRCQEAQVVYQLLERMCFSSLWHLVGGTMRPSKLGRGPLEKSIEESARRLG